MCSFVTKLSLVIGLLCICTLEGALAGKEPGRSEPFGGTNDKTDGGYVPRTAEQLKKDMRGALMMMYEADGYLAVGSRDYIAPVGVISWP